MSNPITKEEILLSNIRGMCWKNPFATAMLAGKVETRKRTCKVRGLVLIIATAEPVSGDAIDDYSSIPLRNLMHAAIRRKGVMNHLKMNGYAIGIGRLVGSWPMRKEDEEQTFVNFDESRHCWQFDDVVPIKPFKIKGFQGWRFISDEDKSKIQLYTLSDVLRDTILELSGDVPDSN